METLEALAKGLSEAQRKALLSDGTRMPEGQWMPNYHHATGKRLVEKGVVELDGWEYSPSLTPLGLALRAHLLAQKDRTPS